MLNRLMETRSIVTISVIMILTLVSVIYAIRQSRKPVITMGARPRDIFDDAYDALATDKALDFEEVLSQRDSLQDHIYTEVEEVLSSAKRKFDNDKKIVENSERWGNDFS